ncbi:MAG TPA: ABC transporter permease [Thermoanaerobaculia bacterium]|nr:ABC transporter permease [Thermoanaerobaculia bacterium]
MIKHLLKLVWNRKRANALIVGEIFVSFLVIFAVLTGAITLIGGWRAPIGFDYRNVWDVRMDFDNAQEQTSPEMAATVMRMIAEVRAMPEVESAAISTTPPYSFSTSEGTRTINGREVSVLFDDVTDDFAEVMKLKVVRGRWFNATDDAAQQQPLVLDTNAARDLFGEADPVGQKWELDENQFGVVVGVVSSYRKSGEVSMPANMMFRRSAPNGRYGRLGNHILVRLRPGTPAVFEEKLAARLHSVAPNVSFRVRHMELMRDSMVRTRLAPIIIGGIVGVFLISMVALGLTGVLWQNVTTRTRELGLRRAMGASGGAVHRQILGEVALLATVALLVGVIVVAQLPILGAFSIVTPSSFTAGILGALATIYALTVLCGLYPSWLASRLQPADALRYE